jgi:uncharacterized protein YjbI with pentapeptide repeats
VTSCKFSAGKEIYYTDYSNNQKTKFVCPYKPAGGKSLCVFHEVKKTNNQNVNKKFCELVSSANKSNKPLLCIGFKISNLEFPKEIKNMIYLNYAQLDNIDFGNVHFLDNADFSYSSFNEPNFSGAIFEKKAYFILARFDGKSFFRESRFYDDANFNIAEFSGEASFYPTYFLIKREKASPYLAYENKPTRAPLTSFNMAKFFSGVRFDGSVFDHQVSFYDTCFKPYAGFTSTTFNSIADFQKAHFEGYAYFGLSKFKSLAYFQYSSFQTESRNGTISLNGADFQDIDFKHSKFDELNFNSEIMIFRDQVTKDLNKTRFHGKVNFTNAVFRNPVRVYNSSFDQAVDFTDSIFEGILYSNDDTVFKSEIIFTRANFEKRVEFKGVLFSAAEDKIRVNFDSANFREFVKFSGKSIAKIDLSSTSFKGVGLSKFEFNNVKWYEKHEKFSRLTFFKRDILIDEILLEENGNYEDVIKIYSQLRKNYESRLLFNEASAFFIGEMECKRKLFMSRKNYLDAFGFWLYKWIAFYGESVRMPLAFWTPVIIGIFSILRFFPEYTLPVNSTEIKCGIFSITFGCLHNSIIDSLSAYFQFPRGSNTFDIIERILSAPILGATFIALKRRFERNK